MILTSIATLALLAAEPLAPGDHVRGLEVDGQNRSYLMHIPPQYDPRKPAAVVLALHGAGMNAAVMAAVTNLSKRADEAGFVVVYPNGTGRTQFFLVWNSGILRGRLVDGWPDDVKFVDRLLDDLATVVHVDANRVYATGISNGAMMCYRLAAELSERIAAIAPVAGTMATDDARPKRPVPILHIHGTADSLVPFAGSGDRVAKWISFKSVRDTIRTWTAINGCPDTPETAELADIADDGTRVQRETYGPCKNGAEVVLYVIDKGGHTWPGWELPRLFLGNTTRDISANDLIWEFFQKHPITRPAEEPADGETREVHPPGSD